MKNPQNGGRFRKCPTCGSISDYWVPICPKCNFDWAENPAPRFNQSPPTGDLGRKGVIIQIIGIPILILFTSMIPAGGGIFSGAEKFLYFGIGWAGLGLLGIIIGVISAKADFVFETECKKHGIVPPTSSFSAGDISFILGLIPFLIIIFIYKK